MNDLEKVNMEVILTRDQRTTSHRVLERCVSCETVASSASFKRTKLVGRRHRTNSVGKRQSLDTRICGGTDVRTCQVSICESCRVTRCNHSCGRLERSKFTSALPTWLRLGSLFLSLFVIVQGAPTMTLEGRRLSSPPKWVNPCGVAAEDFDGDLDVVQLTDDQLLHQVVLQAKTALIHAQMFRDNYVKRTFNTDFADFHLTWKDNHYNWLPSQKEIPKRLGEQLDPEFLDKLEVRMLDAALLDAYEYMQKYAVGLEQIVWDQEDLRLEFRKQFKDAESQLRAVLCELQVALVERGVTPRPDVTRNVMPSEYRAMSNSNTYRNLRDWLIFRDYMNGLEYIVQVFEHLLVNLAS